MSFVDEIFDSLRTYRFIESVKIRVERRSGRNMLVVRSMQIVGVISHLTGCRLAGGHVII